MKVSWRTVIRGSEAGRSGGSRPVQDGKLGKSGR